MSSRTHLPAQALNGKSGRHERRVAERFLCRTECIARPVDAPGVGSWSGMVYNISSTGLGLALTYPVPPGTELLIEPLGPSQAVKVHARVIRCTLESFIWFHGCQFTEPLNAEQIQTWLA